MYQLSASDLEIILVLARSRTLAEAASSLNVDATTVSRALRKIESGLGQQVFDRRASGYKPTALGHKLVSHSELLEARLREARADAQLSPGQDLGAVRLTSTEVLLYDLVTPLLGRLQQEFPNLSMEFCLGNKLSSLTRREADLALRSTNTPPEHLIGKRIGPLRFALFSASHAKWTMEDVRRGRAPWIAPDDVLPDHLTVSWRRQNFPSAIPSFRANSIFTVKNLVQQGLGVGLLPIFLAQCDPTLQPLTSAISECETDLWLLMHPELKHLKSVSRVFKFLSVNLALH